MITKVVFSAAAALVVASGVAAPASADPSAFGVLSCSCGEPVTTVGAVSGDSTEIGIQNGLGLPEGSPTS